MIKTIPSKLSKQCFYGKQICQNGLCYTILGKEQMDDKILHCAKKLKRETLRKYSNRANSNGLIVACPSFLALMQQKLRFVMACKWNGQCSRFDPLPIFRSHPSPEHDLDSLDTVLSDPALRHAVLPNRRVSRVASALVLPPLLSTKRNRILERTESTSILTLNTPLVPWSRSREAKASLLSLISALYGLIIVIMAFSLEVSAFINEESSPSQYDAFYVYQYVVGLLFLTYCYMFLLRDKGWKIPLPFYKKTVSNKNLNRFTAENAAQSWMIVGNKAKKDKVSYASNSNTGIFGIMGIVDKLINIYAAIELGHVGTCYCPINVAEDTIGAVFIFVQLYFIFENSKISIHKLPGISRFGTMHLVATNLCMWMRSIMAEEYHLLMDIEGNGKDTVQELQSSTPNSDEVDSHISKLGLTTHKHNCTLFQTERSSSSWNLKPFLTTCLIEYTVICAAMMYVLWRNTGAKTSTVDRSIRLRKRNVHIDCSSSTKGLFIGLVFFTFTLISMIIFFTKVNKNQHRQALIVCYISDSTLYVAAIVAICAAFYRMRNLNYTPTGHKGLLLDDILLIVGLVSQLMMCVFAMAALTRFNLTSSIIVTASLLRMIEILMQTVFIFYAQRLSTTTNYYSNGMQQDTASESKPGRELVVFLLMINLAMFLINTFETQKSGSNPVTIQFYGKATWTAITCDLMLLGVNFDSTISSNFSCSQVYGSVKVWEEKIL
uniref:Otopetrin-2 n=1 Tax=Romanomermis culicivorax TaxID=13658 RepID=A0A915KEK0_ROMCU